MALLVTCLRLWLILRALHLPTASSRDSTLPGRGTLAVARDPLSNCEFVSSAARPVWQHDSRRIVLCHDGRGRQHLLLLTFPPRPSRPGPLPSPRAAARRSARAPPAAASAPRPRTPPAGTPTGSQSPPAPPSPGHGPAPSASPLRRAHRGRHGAEGRGSAAQSRRLESAPGTSGAGLAAPGNRRTDTHTGYEGATAGRPSCPRAYCVRVVHLQHERLLPVL